AHCVCALRLADTSLAGTRKVRMGRQTRINPNGHTYHVAQADVLPGKTSCFPGTGAGSCDSLCRGDWAHGAGLTGTDAALVFTTKFEPVDPAPCAQSPLQRLSHDPAPVPGKQLVFPGRTSACATW